MRLTCKEAAPSTQVCHAPPSPAAAPWTLTLVNGSLGGLHLLAGWARRRRRHVSQRRLLGRHAADAQQPQHLHASVSYGDEKSSGGCAG